jgi:hypothetical protein
MEISNYYIKNNYIKYNYSNWCLKIYKYLFNIMTGFMILNYNLEYKIKIY